MRVSLLLLSTLRHLPAALAWTHFSLESAQFSRRRGWIDTGVLASSSQSSPPPAPSSFTASNSNVVLAPSYDDPTAFDSFKIGSPRVHRYSRGATEDAETVYVMWYHGRSRDMALDGSLPPLSTGRIGRATSRNGLAWVKDGTGSESEDARDVTLGLNKDSWWGFDTAHVGLGNVLLPMSTPAVLSDAGVFLMYYHGGSEEKTLAVDYVSDEAARKLQDAIKDKEVKGMKMRIGVALSQDGISFGRVEGDDPSGACIVPFDKSDPNQKLDQINAKLEEELYCAWPEVVLNQQGDESNFLMYYSTMTKSDKIKCIAQAVSPDGFRWTKTGVCIRPDPEGYDAGGCARCCVLRDASYDSESGIWKEENSWIMYYEGVSAVDGKHRIMEARSGDGVKWTKAGVALAPRDDVWAWDNGGVGSPHVLRLDDGSLRMYYTGQGADQSTAVGVARKGAWQGAEWTREQASITFANE